MWSAPAGAALAAPNDLAAVALLRELLDWVPRVPPLAAACDGARVLLVGHSRGGKLAALAAAEDERIASLFLLEPVDVTVYAPLSPTCPSAAAALGAAAAAGRRVPLAALGAGAGADCNQGAAANHEAFYAAAGGPAWEVVVPNAGHLQVLDNRGASALNLVCAAPAATPDAAVGGAAKAALVAWAEATMRGGGGGGGEGLEGALREGEAAVRRALRAGGAPDALAARSKNLAGWTVGGI